MPSDKVEEAVSKTLEYAYDDWAMAHLAKAAGAKTTTARCWRSRATTVTCSTRPTTSAAARWRNGDWVTPFDPRDVGHDKKWRDFTESNGWQATFLNQHDVHHYMDHVRRARGVREQARRLVQQRSELPPDAPPDIAGMVGQYAHGNEPSHHVAYLYAYAGQHYKTQARVRMLLPRHVPRPARRPGRQRGLRPDERLVRAQRAGLLRGRSGQRATT